MHDGDDRTSIESITSPQVYRVDRGKDMAMREALLAVLPAEPPGLSVAAAKAALLTHLSAEQFPNGEMAGWWLKAVQLDLEKKGVIRRAQGAPVRLYRTEQPRRDW